MKKIVILALGLALLLALTATPVMAGRDRTCITIQDGIISYSEGHYLAGEPLQTGYDVYGYNYQAHMFNGSYVNSYLGGAGFPPYDGDDEGYLAENPDAKNHWAWPYRDVQLMMKWSDIWLSNKDCNQDGKLDRGGPGGTSSAAPGAWLTNHQWGYNEDGSWWTYFVKIVAVPADAYKSDDGETWYRSDGTEIGPVIWTSYAVVQRVSNDPSAGEHGILYLSPASPGFGFYKP